MKQYELYLSAIELLKREAIGYKDEQFEKVIDSLFRDLFLCDAAEQKKFLSILLNTWMKGVIRNYKLDRFYSEQFTKDGRPTSMIRELDALAGFEEERDDFILSPHTPKHPYHVPEMERIAEDVLAIIHERGWDDKL